MVAALVYHDDAIGTLTSTMANFIDEAREHARAVAALTGHSDKDWAVLSMVSGTTMSWAPRLAREFVSALGSNPETAPFIAGKRDARETSLAAWFERLLRGTAAEGFWSECVLVGLAHVSAGVPPAMVIAGGRYVEEVFLGQVMNAFGPEEALRIHAAFTRTLTTAIAVMSAAADAATRSTLERMGVSPAQLREQLRLDNEERGRTARAELPRLEWNGSLSVGVQSIDDQHRQLFELLDELQRANTEDREASLRLEIVDDLIDHTKIHLAFEETLLARHGYPDLVPHRAAHARLAAQVEVHAAVAQSGAGPLGGELYFFLRTWLNGHICGTDRLYSRFLNDQGVR